MSLDEIILAYALVYAASIVGGGFAAQYVGRKLRRHVAVQEEITPNEDPKGPSVLWLNWSIGVTERAIATTLVIFDLELASLFVGGWVALKFAANWERRTADNDKMRRIVARYSLVALVGNAVSFTFAVMAGILLRHLT